MALKIKPEHLRQLRDAIEPLNTPTLRKKYSDRDVPRAERIKDVDKRYRWDLLWSAVPSQFMTELYTYLNDTHIDSAIASFIPKLEA